MQGKTTILITGATGYIGSYVTKALAATNPAVQVLAMSRSDPQEASKKRPDVARFTNVKFVQANCLDKDSLERLPLDHCTAIIHSVGTLFEGQDYKK